MASDKDIRLIRRLLLEGAEDLSGEWWIDDSGDATFADGDVGDYTHAMVALEAALGIDLEDSNAPEIIPMEPLSPEAMAYLEEIDSPSEAVEFLKDGADPRDYAIIHMGWIRVMDNNFQVWTFDNGALVRIGDFLSEMTEDDSGNVNIEEHSTHDVYSVPAKMVLRQGSTVEAIKHYVRGVGRFRDENVVKYVSAISEDLIPAAIEAIMSNDPRRRRPEEGM